ncbi:MAG: restriction endonuclease subunit S [Sulfuricurvum sp.]|nr:restriction endonuclease subunit S [Sulfuricurvum sp.]
MSAQMNVPKLRFPEFSGGWEIKKFDEIFTFSTGKNIKQNEASSEFETPCVRYGELYHMYDEVISKIINRTNLDKSELLFSQGNEILLPSAGEDPMDIGSASALTIENVAIGRTINILKPLKANIYSQIFVAYYINHKLKKNISKLAKGVSISNVYNSDLKTLEINLPYLEEQTKIADFLTDIDTKIDQLTQKQTLLKQYKKGVIQKLFSQELRFKADDGSEFPEWEEKTLGELLDYLQPTKYLVDSTEYNDSHKTPVLTAGKTFILGYTDETIGIFNDNLPVIIFDDFTTATKFVDFPFKAKSSAMKILIPNKNVNIKFVYEAMQIIRYEIGGHERHWISKYSQLYISVPSIEEQTRITTFLTTIDTKINFATKQLEATKQFKKALLQQMFV